jgi:hypothetical protein
VGNCTEKILYIIYNFIKEILKNEYRDIAIDTGVPKKVIKKKKRVRKKKILVKKIVN